MCPYLIFHAAIIIIPIYFNWQFTMHLPGYSIYQDIKSQLLWNRHYIPNKNLRDLLGQRCATFLGQGPQRRPTIFSALEEVLSLAYSKFFVSRGVL